MISKDTINGSANNRYQVNPNTTTDSFCDPAYATEPTREENNIAVHRRTPSASMARLVWRFKKRAAAAIYEKYRYKIQEAFEIWKSTIQSKEHLVLRNEVLRSVILSRDHQILRDSLAKIKHHCRNQKLKEAVSIKLMERWRKRFVFKVFKILRKQKHGERKHSKPTISRKNIKKLQK